MKCQQGSTKLLFILPVLFLFLLGVWVLGESHLLLLILSLLFPVYSVLL